jgi:hypothetical protein
VPERQKAFLTSYDFLGSVTKAAKGVCHPHNHFGGFIYTTKRSDKLLMLLIRQSIAA